jgi:multidrug efflux system membrane fusion protein
MDMVTRRKPFMRICLSLFVICPLLALTLACNRAAPVAAESKGGGKKGGGGDVPVTVTKVIRKSTPIEIQVIGNVEAYATVSVKPQISGQLMQAYFREGDSVQQGQKLFDIDRKLLESQLAQAQTNLAKGEAQIRQAQAALARDQATATFTAQQAKRYAELATQGIFSRDANDQIQTQAKTAEQTVTADLAVIESAKADLAATGAMMDNIKVQLTYTVINAPISGRTGNLTVKVGNVVVANTTELITINQVEPIYVTFAVPEAQLNEIRNYMAKGKLAVFATPQDSTEAESGTLTFVDNTVDPTTGTIRMKATFNNSNRRLWPGLFVRVTVRLGLLENALVLPNQAVQTGQNGQFVYVVKEDRSVEARPVEVGARVGEELIVEKGLEAGETVVLEGQLRIAPNSRVSPRDGTEGSGRKKGKGGNKQ